jgi:hypothetical protein
MEKRRHFHPGYKNGRLTILRQHNTTGTRTYLCRCDCGTEWLVVSSNIRSTRSCGCLQRENFTFRTHGKSKTRLYGIWNNMRQRCLNSNNPNFQFYGGRGIKVCGDWGTFEPFEKWALANGYVDGLTIERVNNDGNYEPANCEWASRLVQSNNTRAVRRVLCLGEMLPVKAAADKLGVKPDLIYWRLRRGDDPTKACVGL